jgi:hypothetical protein
MAAPQSLYQLKQQGLKKKNQNTITDADYFLRDKEEEATRGYPNSIDMTPAEVPARRKKKVVAKGE